MIVRNIPYYLQVANTLREELRSGKYPAYSEFPDEMSLALRFGVSKEVIRQSRKILCEEHLIRTLKGRGTYVLSQEQTENKAVLLNLFHCAMQAMRILQAVQKVTLQENYLLSVHATEVFSLKTEEQVLLKTLENKCKAVVTCPSIDLQSNNNSELYSKIRQQGIPVILFDRYIANDSVDQVYFDNERTGYETISAIAGECDPRHLVIVSGERYLISEQRMRGITRGLKEFFPNIPEKNLIWGEPLNDVYTDIYNTQYLLGYLKKHRISPEVLVGDGLRIWGLYEALRKLKQHKNIRKIVISHDTFIGDEEFNAITTGFYRDFDELGCEIAKLLKKRLIYGVNGAPIKKGIPFRKMTYEEITKRNFDEMTLHN